MKIIILIIIILFLVKSKISNSIYTNKEDFLSSVINYKSYFGIAQYSQHVNNQISKNIFEVFNDRDTLDAFLENYNISSYYNNYNELEIDILNNPLIIQEIDNNSQEILEILNEMYSIYNSNTNTIASQRLAVLNKRDDDVEKIKEKKERRITNKGKIEESVSNFLYKNTNYVRLLFLIGLHPECLSKMKEFNSFGTETFQLSFEYSGKSFNDLGEKAKCLEEGLSYILLEYKMKNYKYKTYKIEDLHKFLDLYRYFTGLCIPSQCMEVAEAFFSPTKNPKFTDYLKNIGVVKLKISQNSNKTTIDKTNWRYYLSIWMIRIFSIFILFRFLYTLISHSIIKYYSNKELGEFKRDDEEINESDINRNKSKIFNNSSFESEDYSPEINISPRHIEISKIKIFFLRLNKFLSILTSFHYLLSKNNRLYKNTNLGFLSFVKFLSILFITLSYIFQVSSTLPHRDKGDDFYLNYFNFGFIKFSSFWTDVFIVLEGAVFAYKFLSYIQKSSSDNEFNLTICKLFNFLCYQLSRVILFFFIYFAYYICIREIGDQVESSEESEILIFFQRLYYGSQSCYYTPIEPLIPFYSQYKQNNFYYNATTTIPHQQFQANSFHNYACFDFVMLFNNLFLSTIFTGLIVYFCLLIRKKYFDFTITVIIVINYFLIFLYCLLLDYNNNFVTQMTLDFIFGETISLIQTHIFFSTFFLGFLFGLTYFYYVDVINNSILYTDFLKINIEVKNISLEYDNAKNNNNNYNNEQEFINNISNSKNKPLITRGTKTSIYLKNKDNINPIYSLSSEVINNKKRNTAMTYNKLTTDSYLTQFEEDFVEEKHHNYLPFQHCFYLMHYLEKIKSWLFIRLFCLVLILLASIMFRIIISINDDRLNADIGFWTYLVYCYEKKVFTPCIFILVSSQIFNKKSYYNTRNTETYLFYYFDRLSLTYFAMIEAYLLFFFSYFDIEYYISAFNMIVFTISITITLIFFVSLLSALYEIPFRALMKFCLRKKVIEDN